jgi:hypothetical protein
MSTLWMGSHLNPSTCFTGTTRVSTMGQELHSYPQALGARRPVMAKECNSFANINVK